MADHDSTQSEPVTFHNDEPAEVVRDRNLRHIQALSLFMCSDKVQTEFTEGLFNHTRIEFFDLIESLASDAITAQDLLDEQRRATIAAARENGNG